MKEQEPREEFVSGFCRVQNQGRTVTCELKKEEQGWMISWVDCGFPNCLHKGSCQIAKEIEIITNN